MFLTRNYSLSFFWSGSAEVLTGNHTIVTWRSRLGRSFQRKHVFTFRNVSKLLWLHHMEKIQFLFKGSSLHTFEILVFQVPQTKLNVLVQGLKNMQWLNGTWIIACLTLCVLVNTIIIWSHRWLGNGDFPWGSMKPWISPRNIEQSDM